MCRFKGLTSEDMLVYQSIEAAANQGIAEGSHSDEEVVNCRMIGLSFVSRYYFASSCITLNEGDGWACFIRNINPCSLLAGIWTADLKRRTNLQQPQINKALKNLEGRSLVKAVKTVTVRFRCPSILQRTHY